MKKLSLRRRLVAPSSMATGLLKISADDPSIHTLAVDYFTGEKFIGFAVLIAKDNVVTFCQVLGLEVIDQLLFAIN